MTIPAGQAFVSLETKKGRGRPRVAEVTERRRAIAEIVNADGPMSVRHAYYRAVVAGLVPKTEAGYTKVKRAVLDLRRSGVIPYRMIVDSTRWMRKPRTWRSLEEMLANAAASYRRNKWANSPWRVEVWVESDSIAGTVVDVTFEWDVPLMVCRGQVSETFAYAAAEAWSDDPYRDPVVLYVGDLDPAGLEIEAALQRKLEGFYGEEVKWQRIGITGEQVEAHELWDAGTKPKKPYGYSSAWEAEALPAPVLRSELEQAIEVYVDPAAFEGQTAAEVSEREILVAIARVKRGEG